MSANRDQHFVPQFYFRRFTAGRAAVHLLLTNSGRIVLNASVRSQCSGHRFYGSAKAEQLLTQLEVKHAPALRAIAEAANTSDYTRVTPEDYLHLLQSILLQRSRTALQVDKVKDTPTNLLMPRFRAYIASKSDIENREEILNAIDKGQVRVVETRETAVFRQIAIAMECVILISDLGACVLRNLTDYPFIFSDSPVVLYNTLYSQIRSRGVLGLQSPGLQIFYPLGPDMLVMLYDRDAYHAVHEGHFDITERSDVSQLNAMQLHHSLNAVYFGDRETQDYVATLWLAHRHAVVKPTIECRILHDAIVDGKTSSYPVLQMLEPQLNVQLRLSFIHCQLIPEANYRFRRRNPELMAEFKKRTNMADIEL